MLSLCFNPLPSPKQGETCAIANLYLTLNVSIRSPHRSKGRPQSYGDYDGLLRGFNPLPSPKQGETVDRTAERVLAEVSIRSPHRSKGRLWLGSR